MKYKPYILFWNQWKNQYENWHSFRLINIDYGDLGQADYYIDVEIFNLGVRVGIIDKDLR